MNFLSELEKADQYPKFYWEDRDTDEALGGYGANYTLSDFPKNSSDFVFGGGPFCKSSKDTVWHDVPPSFFFNPRVIFSSQKDTHPSTSTHLKYLSKTETPTLSEWQKLIASVLSKIEYKFIEKVVLARRSSLTFEEKINPFDVLKNLKSKNNRAVCFLLQFSKDLAFVGATPEKLYSRQGRRLVSDALAGTAPLTDKESILKNPKEQLEFLIVKQFIHAQLTPFCDTLRWEEEDQVIKTSTVQHLYNQVTAELKSGVLDHHLIPLLHPTPAIAGSPRLAALSLLHQKEPLDRGWYASPIGWIEKDKADIAIGIRSCLIRGKEMHLFAGAGIVKESNPEKEWEELNHKMSQFTG